jgi:nitrogen-specific signal transduction histidine kinase
MNAGLKAFGEKHTGFPPERSSPGFYFRTIQEKSAGASIHKQFAHISMVFSLSRGEGHEIRNPLTTERARLLRDRLKTRG